MGLDFDRLYSQYAPMVYRIGILYFKNYAAAEDLVQDVFVKLFTHPAEFNGESHLKAWLITVSRNACRNLKKKQSRLVPLPDNLPYADKADSCLPELYKLPEKDRLVVYLHYYEGYTSAEIAKMTQSTEMAVRARLKRSRAALKIILEDKPV